ncbi:uncharacterized protein [Primulina eburnea]|uniref:uncharacterized protein n=1 Tax=Primulina eburnea TaxID=1245227 RepID=UPI003C6CB305
MQAEERMVMVPWSFDANWTIAHGSLEGSVTVESPEYLIAESDADDSAPSSPLVLKPSRLDSGPCEIKICFRKKHDLCQIYVRSTARVYEVYYSCPPQISNEYLCTVRCNAAQRDEMLLQTTGIEYVSKERGDCFVGELPEDIVTDGGSGDDDWVKIKVPEVGRSSLEKTNTFRVKKVQDLYEATAQISDAEPCSLLTIRFLSLQNKSHVYVDEVYIFADLAESTDSANEAVVAGSSTGSSLMAMLLPALLQSTRSSIGPCVKDNHASEDVLKDDKMEIGLRKTDGIDVECSKKQSDRQNGNVLNAAPAISAELQQPSLYPNTNKSIGPMIKMDVGSAGEQVDQQSVKLQELDKDAVEFTEPQQPTPVLTTKPVYDNDSLHYRLERALEQLISRVSRVEDICLRFEEKMLRPMETMESRIQHLETQLQKLTGNSFCCELPHCTRISAPAFSCSKPDSKSFYKGCDCPLGVASETQLQKLAGNSSCCQPPRCTRISAPAFSCSESDSKSLYEPSDCPPGVASDSEKKVFLCEDTSSLFSTANFRPSLVVSAPEFSCSEDDDDTHCTKPTETLLSSEDDDDTHCIKPRETLSIDDALAAALSGFISAAKTNPSDHIQTISGSSSLVDGKIELCSMDESCQKKAQVLSAENYGREPSVSTQIYSIMIPDFTSVENGDDGHLNYGHSSSDPATVYENKDDHDFGMIPSSIQSKKFCDVHENKNMDDFGLTWNESSVVSTSIDRTCILNVHSSDSVKIFESNTVDSSCERVVSCDCTEAGHLVGTCSYQIYLETNPREANTDGLDDQETTKKVLGLDSGCKSVVPERYVAVEESFKDDTPDNLESSCASTVDYEFPILDVEFTFDDYTSTRSPLEALLDGLEELNTEAHSIHDRADDDGNAEQIIVEIMDGNETADLLPSNSLVVDLAVSSEDGSLNSEGLDTVSSHINQEVIVSLI